MRKITRNALSALITESVHEKQDRPLSEVPRKAVPPVAPERGSRGPDDEKLRQECLGAARRCSPTTYMLSTLICEALVYYAEQQLRLLQCISMHLTSRFVPAEIAAPQQVQIRPSCTCLDTSAAVQGPLPTACEPTGASMYAVRCVSSQQCGANGALVGRICLLLQLQYLRACRSGGLQACPGARAARPIST